MRVHRSNDAVRLVEALFRVVEGPPPGAADPLRSETIVVQSAGMGRWLSMELASRRGVWGNPAFPFPRGVIESVLGLANRDEEDRRLPFAAEALRWSLARVLPEMLGDPDFQLLDDYLEEDRSGFALLQLAGRIADTFDRYAIYRPQLVLEWEEGRDEVSAEHRWQPRLWRAVRELHGDHLAGRARAFLSRLARNPQSLELSRLPPRLSLFGISTLPPVFVEVLAALGRHVDLHLFTLVPTPEYFGDARSRRAQARDGSSGAVGAWDAPHPFLGSMGRVAAEFQDILEDHGAGYLAGEEVFAPPVSHTLLGMVQGAVFGVRESAPVSRAVLGDGSIRVHSCHSPMREVQVLHNELLDLLASDPDLRPRDVIVMTPDIDRYAPYVESVFGSSAGGAIPYRVADRSARASFGVVEAFLRVLEVAAGRLTAPEVVDLLNFQVVRDRFSLSAEDTEAVREMVDDLAIRWGRDGDHRQAEGQPPFAENTWRFGLDRLLLGQAMGDAGLWNGVLPWAGASGRSGLVAGQFVEFCEAVFDAGRALRGERTVEGWCEVLVSILQSMLRVPDAVEFQAAHLRNTLDEFRRFCVGVGFDTVVSSRAVIEQLDRALRGSAATGTFLGGGVTFCELVPMRSIPFRRVCILGLDHDCFPRHERPPGFSLMGLNHKRGDRSPRDDDRYLFLEALLAARDGLWLSYVGQGIQDNRVRPPSVLVDELLDEIERLSGGDGEAVRPELVTHHPIQSFSPRYFSGSAELFSYSVSDFEAARALLTRQAPVPFLTRLPVDSGEPETDIDVGLGDLLAFFRFPARAFLQRRLGLYLDRRAASLADREPIEMDALEQWAFGESYLRLRLEGADRASALRRLEGQGRSAPGALVGVSVEGVEARAAQIVEVAQRLRGPRRPTFCDADIAVPGGRVRGRLGGLHDGGLLLATYSKLKGGRQLEAWIQHLVLCVAAPEGVRARTHMVGQGSRWEADRISFGPVTDPAGILGELLRIYRAGQEVPLPFFASEAVCLLERAMATGVDPSEVTLSRSQHSHQPRSDWARQAFGDKDPLAIEVDAGNLGVLDFSALAPWICTPMLSAREVS